MIGRVVTTTETMYGIQEGYGNMDMLTVEKVGAWWSAKTHDITEVPAGARIKLLETGRGGAPHFDQCYVAILSKLGGFHPQRDTYYMPHKAAQRLGLLDPDATPPKPLKTYTKMMVEIDDCFDNQVFECYTAADLWNGWQCPHFTKENADKLMAADVHAVNKYDPETDTYDFGTGEIVDDPKNHTIVKGVDIVVDGQTVHVYPIGAWSWCWDNAAINFPYSDDVVIGGYSGHLTVEDIAGNNLLEGATFEDFNTAEDAARKLVWGE